MNYTTREERAEIIRLHKNGLSNRRIARKVGRDSGTVGRIVRSGTEANYQAEDRERHRKLCLLSFSHAGPDPTQEEIRAACAEIRKTWPADEWERRAVGVIGPVEVRRLKIA